FAVLLIGYAATLAQTVQGNIIGDYSGSIRLAFLGSLLLLPALTYRMVVGELETEIAAPASDAPPSARLETAPAAVATAPDRESAQLMKALGIILDNATLETIPEHIVQATINVLKTDIGALLTVQAANYADITWGMDQVMDRTVTSLSLNLADQPT